MKKFVLLLIALSTLNLPLSTFNFQLSTCKAQDMEGTPYYLPKTELRFQLLIEKTQFTPGEFAIYSERYLKKKAETEPNTTYRILGIKMYTTAIPDTAKAFIVPMDKKHSIYSADVNDDGILLAINDKAKRTETPSIFKMAKKVDVADPHDYMNEDILNAGSTAKMAELTAADIKDIRSSKDELSRGQADYMPKDGEQLKLMFQNLDKKESMLLQTFLGVGVKDTLQKEVVFCPENEGKSMLFRFSKKLGLVDTDDLAGVPYYVNVTNLETIPEIQTEVEGMKASTEDGIAVNMPSKIKIQLLKDNEEVDTYETYAAQFGEEEFLSANLFGRKFTTHIQLNPVTGMVEHMEVEPLE